MTEPAAGTVVQWILDTRKLWTEATQTKQLETVVCPPQLLSISSRRL